MADKTKEESTEIEIVVDTRTEAEKNAAAMKDIMERLETLEKAPIFSKNTTIEPVLDQNFLSFLNSASQVGYKNMLTFSDMLLESVRASLATETDDDPFDRYDMVMVMLGVCEEFYKEQNLR